MAVELKNIPGLAEKVAAAERLEGELRDLPFLEVNLEICGIEVKQFTPRHFLYLDTAKNPFLCGGIVEPEHVAQFLWVVSPAFKVGAKAERDAFLSTILDVEVEHREDTSWTEAMAAAIDEYLGQAFMDRPASGGSTSSAPVTSYLAALIAKIAMAFGWSKAEILDTPFAELFQYWRRIQLEENTRAKFINRFTDRARRESVREYLQQQKEGK